MSVQSEIDRITAARDDVAAAIEEKGVTAAGLPLAELGDKVRAIQTSAVKTVAGVGPDASGNVPLTAANVGALATNGTAASATKLATKRIITTDLESDFSDGFDGSANVTIRATGRLRIANGGTGAITAADARTNLGVAATNHAVSSLGVTSNLETGIGNPFQYGHVKVTDYPEGIKERGSCVYGVAASAYALSLLQEKLMPIGTIIEWAPVSGSDIDLSTADKVAAHYGFGTWEAYGAGRGTVGTDTSHAAGTTWGEATHTLTEAEMPSHTHAIASSYNNSYAIEWPRWTKYSKDTGELSEATNKRNEWRTTSTGSGTAHNNWQPSIAVYRWRRIA